MAVGTDNPEPVKLITELGKANPFVGDNRQNYSSYNLSVDANFDNIVVYFDSIRSKFD